MDLTQSIFIAVLRALPSYRVERASFRTWLYRIAANKVIDARRKSRPVSFPIEEMELPAAEDFAARVHDQALLETIEGYISGLDPGEQAAVKSRYYRLIGRLRKEFGADGS
jgi:RNA polymerase sigma-70 factor (ECF subfamily)